MSRWVHGPVFCLAYLPAAGFEAKHHQVYRHTAQLRTSSLYILRHNIYSFTWPVCIVLFQINDPTIYLLGFYSFSVLQPKSQLYPNFWLGHVIEPSMEALGSQHHAGLTTRATPNPPLSAGTLLQVTTKEPLVCLSTYGCPILLPPMRWGHFEPCSTDVLLHDKHVA